MSSSSPLVLRWSALSDVGRVRKDNQDSGYAGQHLLAVADGVGGAARGDIASSTAIESLRRLDVPPDGDPLAAIGEAIQGAHDRISEVVEEHPELEGTSTTVTVAVFDGTRVGVGHVGDSRAYLLRGGELRQLTKDHTFVQGLIDEGRITEAESRTHPHRNLILRAVDGRTDSEPDLFNVDLEVGDRLLLCSDGCCGVLERTDLARLLGDGSLDFACVQLISASLEAGSTDNVTVVVADVLASDDPALTAEDAEETSAAASIGPMLVGAAAEGPRPPSGRRMRGLRRPDTGELDPVPADAAAAGATANDVDPETLRYAPRAPKRFPWLRRLAVLLGVAGVLYLVGAGAYAWTQTQYFVADRDGRVTIFQGVEADLPGVSLHSVAETSSLRLGDLPDDGQLRVRGGISADDLAAARTVVGRLRDLACPSPAPTPSATPTPSPSASPTAGRTRRPNVRPRQTGSAAPLPTPTPAATPSAAPLPASCTEDSYQ